MPTLWDNVNNKKHTFNKKSGKLLPVLNFSFNFAKFFVYRLLELVNLVVKHFDTVYELDSSIQWRVFVSFVRNFRASSANKLISKEFSFNFLTFSTNKEALNTTQRGRLSDYFNFNVFKHNKACINEFKNKYTSHNLLSHILGFVSLNGVINKGFQVHG